MKVLILFLTLTLAAAAGEPDYKALYLKANEAAAQWKALAEKRAAENEQILIKLELAETRAQQRQVKQAAAPNPILAKLQAEEAERERIHKASNGPRFGVFGKVLSVTSEGILVSPGDQWPAGTISYHPAATGISFVEIDPSAFADGDPVYFIGALNGFYEYKQVAGGMAKVRRYYCVENKTVRR